MSQLSSVETSQDDDEHAHGNIKSIFSNRNVAPFCGILCLDEWDLTLGVANSILITWVKFNPSTGWNFLSIPKLRWCIHPLKFGNGQIILSHTLLGIWLLIHGKIKVNPPHWGPLSFSVRSPIMKTVIARSWAMPSWYLLCISTTVLEGSSQSPTSPSRPMYTQVHSGNECVTAARCWQIQTSSPFY